MTPRAVITLGIGQCVNWGVLYYAFAVLLLPVEAELGAARWIVTGAFSLALLVSALAAPIVGRRCDRGHAPRLMRTGGYAAAGLLAVWALAPGLWTLYLCWAGLGLCMAAALYEPAFAVIGRAHDDMGARLRALGIVTLCGGLASTVFLPLTDAIVRAAGWRAGVIALAGVLALSTAIVDRFALGPVTLIRDRARNTGVPERPSRSGAPPWFLIAAFGFTSLSGAAVIANLVPALAERSVAPATAAAFGGIFGLMQLPGRALMTHGRFSPPPFGLLAASLALQAAGLVLWASVPSAASAFAGLASFAIGSGLTTLVRPYLVHAVFEPEHAGSVNGRLAQAQQFARAAGPILVAWAAFTIGYGAVLGLLGVVFAAFAAVSWRTSLRRVRGLTSHDALTLG